MVDKSNQHFLGEKRIPVGLLGKQIRLCSDNYMQTFFRRWISRLG